MDFIEALEKSLALEAQKEFLPMQPGDVEKTWANVDDLARDYGYRPDTLVKHGISKFVEWYKEYHKIDTQ